MIAASTADVPSSVSPRRTSTASTRPKTMRPLAPIDLPDLHPAPLAGMGAPIVDHLRPGDLLVDEVYQRALSPRSLALIRRIVEQWDWLKFKAPVVAMTDLGFEVVDGQHTAIAAACHPEVDKIPVLVVDGSDLQRRARAFVSHAVDRLKATPVQIWHAALAAGDEDATTIRNVLDRAGVTMLLRPPGDAAYGARETVAIGAVRRLVDRRGAMRAREVLELLARADLAPISADHVRIAEVLLCDPGYAGGMTADAIMAAVRDTTPKQVAEAAELALAKRMPAWRALTAVLYRAHHATKRGRPKVAEPTAPAVARDVVVEPVAEIAAEPAQVEPPAAAARASGVGDVPMAELVAGIERWRRGGSWDPAWGPAPDKPDTGVPAALLGPVAVIVGRERFTVVIERTMALWRLHRAWPASGWGPSPEGRDCAVPFRFREEPKAA